MVEHRERPLVRQPQNSLPVLSGVRGMCPWGLRRHTGLTYRGLVTL